MAGTRKPRPKATREQSALARSIRAYARHSYPVAEVRFARCPCGEDVFSVEADDDAGGAERRCLACDRAHLIADSAEYWDDAEPERCTCTCDEQRFQVAVGFAFTRDRSKDVRWLYIGLRCVACGLA